MEFNKKKIKSLFFIKKKKKFFFFFNKLKMKYNIQISSVKKINSFNGFGNKDFEIIFKNKSIFCHSLILSSISPKINFFLKKQKLIKQIYIDEELSNESINIFTKYLLGEKISFSNSTLFDLNLISNYLFIPNLLEFTTSIIIYNNLGKIIMENIKKNENLNNFQINFISYFLISFLNKKEIINLNLNILKKIILNSNHNDILIDFIIIIDKFKKNLILEFLPLINFKNISNNKIKELFDYYNKFDINFLNNFKDLFIKGNLIEKNNLNINLNNEIYFLEHLINLFCNFNFNNFKIKKFKNLNNNRYIIKNLFNI